MLDVVSGALSTETHPPPPGQEDPPTMTPLLEDHPPHVRNTLSASTTAVSPLVECPLCLAFFPSYAIELHASECATGGDSGGMRSADNINSAFVVID